MFLYLSIYLSMYTCVCVCVCVCVHVDVYMLSICWEYDYVWTMTGLYLDYVWTMSGVCLEYVWSMSGVCLDYGSYMSGLYLDCTCWVITFYFASLPSKSAYSLTSHTYTSKSYLTVDSSISAIFAFNHVMSPLTR